MLFSRGLIGGGDVKLLAAAALWAGADALPPLLLLTALIGGLLALLFLTPLGRADRGARMPKRRRAEAKSHGRTGPPVPYGVAIAAAALAVTVAPHLG